jgi:hypothetical protein
MTPEERTAFIACRKTFAEESEGKPYRPANGSEGDGFHESYCWQCVHEGWSRMYLAGNEDPQDATRCEIMTAGQMGEQPAEWIYRNGQGHCTKFEQFPEVK